MLPVSLIFMCSYVYVHVRVRVCGCGCACACVCLLHIINVVSNFRVLETTKCICLIMIW